MFPHIVYVSAAAAGVKGIWQVLSLFVKTSRQRTRLLLWRNYPPDGRSGYKLTIILPRQEVLYDLDGFLLDLAAETMSGARHYLEGGVLVGLMGFF